MTRADTRTFAKIKPIYYSTFVDSFDLNPQTGFVAMVENEQSVIQSIKNLVFTNVFERPYQPMIGSKIQNLNFNLNDAVTQNDIVETLTETITNFEPRAQQVQVLVSNSPNMIDANEIEITIIFSLKNINNNIQFSFTLPRVR